MQFERTKESKEYIIDKLSKDFNDNDCFYIINIAGVNTYDLTKLRKSCNEESIIFYVAKNSLIYNGIQKSNKSKQTVDKIGKNILTQMSGILFIKEQYSLPARIIKKIQNDISKGSILLKVAYVDGDVFIGESNLNMLSKLKTKNELIAEMISSLNGCYTNIVLSLNSGINNIYGIFETLKKNIN